MKALEQKQTKESKPPTKEHKGSASVSHPPHSKSLQQERGETDAQALQRVRQNREDPRDQVEELKKSNVELLAKEKDLKKSIDILQERNQQLCMNRVASQAHYLPFFTSPKRRMVLHSWNSRANPSMVPTNR